MALIQKKCTATLFARVASGKKKAEFRLADWDIKEGDILRLLEVDDFTRQPTGRFVDKKVTDVAKFKITDFFKMEDAEKHGVQVISLK